MYEFVAEKLGTSSPPPYLSLSQNDDAILQGVNYASGGAGILNETGQYFVIKMPTYYLLVNSFTLFLVLTLFFVLQIQRLTFDDQINYFKNTKERIRANIGAQAANKLCNEATYFIGIGKLETKVLKFIEKDALTNLILFDVYAGSNDYVNNFLQPFLPDGQQYTHDEFVELLTSTLEKQLLVYK